MTKYKCPFCDEECVDIEEHISRCPETYSGACRRFSEACTKFKEVLLDEFMKLFRIKKDE